jgi:hypothetical protein
MAEPLRVDPVELQLKADQIDGHGADFLTTHGAAHSRASGVALGAGLAGAALPQMLAAWETHGTRCAEQFRIDADDHRQAATAYFTADSSTADRVDDAGSAL